MIVSATLAVSWMLSSLPISTFINSIAAGRPTSQVPRSAANVKVTKLKQGESYRGQVNPKIRALIEAKEYRDMIDLLGRLENQGYLDAFLDKAEEYWAQINLFELAKEEQEGGGRQIMRKLKKEWTRIWPDQLDAERLTAFDLFSTFWKRIDQSKLIDMIMNEILPDLQKGYENTAQSADQRLLSSMTDEQRHDEIFRRLGKSELIGQYAALCKEDPEVRKVAPKVGPWIARFISMLEWKVANQSSVLGTMANFVVVGVSVVLMLLIALWVGAVKLPFGDDVPEIPTSKPFELIRQ